MSICSGSCSGVSADKLSVLPGQDSKNLEELELCGYSKGASARCLGRTGS